MKKSSMPHHDDEQTKRCTQTTKSKIKHKEIKLCRKSTYLNKMTNKLT